MQCLDLFRFNLVLFRNKFCIGLYYYSKLTVIVLYWPAMCSPLVWMFPGLSGLPPGPRSKARPWSARHNSSSSRTENSSPGKSCRLHTEQRKHSMWYTLSRARMTKSLLLKPKVHFAHFIPNNLLDVGKKSKVKHTLEACLLNATLTVLLKIKLPKQVYFIFCSIAVHFTVSPKNRPLILKRTISFFGVKNILIILLDINDRL